MRHHVLIPLTVLLASTACVAESCDALKDQIEAKIKAGGVSSFTLAIVDSEQPDSGKTIGRCGLGTKRIVYAVPSSTVALSAANPSVEREGKPAGKSGGSEVITECKDGSVGGDCSH